MSKLSKTAAAAMRAGESVERKIKRTDEDLIRELRNDRASHIWPSVPAIDALLRDYDRVSKALRAANLALLPETVSVETADA